MSSMTTIVIDSNNCRLCLKKGGKMRCIFGENIQNWTTEDNISKLIQNCTNIEVTVHDATTKICLTCYKKITSITAYRIQCFRANEILRSQYLDATLGDGKAEKSSIGSNNIKGDSVEEHNDIIDLGDDDSIITSNSLWDRSGNFDYEIHDLQESDEKLGESDDVRIDERDVAHRQYNELDSNSLGAMPKSRSKLKRCYKSSSKCVGDWPKLKKRDLIETKAYRGLCHLCGKEYQHLWVHLQSHSQVPTETCDKCGKGFRSKANLSLHILLHKEADMPCEICGKKYRTKMRLKRHMRVHTQNRPFSCSDCQKRFYTKYNLEVHSRVHSGERPFSCSAKNCTERFAHSYALKNHMEKVHRDMNNICK